MVFLYEEVLSKQYEEDALDSLLKLSGRSWQQQRELIEAAAMLTNISQSEAKRRLLNLYIEYGQEWCKVAPRIKALRNGTAEPNVSVV